MRHQEGNHIIVTFNNQSAYTCKIIAINTDSIEVERVEKLNVDTELPQKITICSGLIKVINMNGCYRKQLN